MSKLKNTVKNAVKQMEDRYYCYAIRKAEYVKIKDKTNCWQQVEFTSEQIQEIEQLYGAGVDTRWHRYYQYFTGKFDAKYLPEILYSTVMESKMNPRKIANEMEDKSRIPHIYGPVSDLRIPKTVVVNTSGIFQDENGDILTKAQAEDAVREYLRSYGSAILKPIRDTGSGQGVIALQANTFEGFVYDRDFIVQERIKNQEDLKVLNPHSLNTMRVMTYICDEQYWCAPLLLRMGSGVTHLDNAHAGGIFIGVKNNGDFCREAYSEYGEKHTFHPYSKIVFEGYRIRNVDRVMKAAIACHKRTPHLKMVSWDLTLDDNGTPVLIEANMFGQSVWLPQIAHGVSIFEDNTEKMLQKYR